MTGPTLPPEVLARLARDVIGWHELEILCRRGVPAAVQYLRTQTQGVGSTGWRWMADAKGITLLAGGPDVPPQQVSFRPVVEWAAARLVDGDAAEAKRLSAARGAAIDLEYSELVQGAVQRTTHRDRWTVEELAACDEADQARAAAERALSEWAAQVLARDPTPVPGKQLDLFAAGATCEPPAGCTATV